MHGDLGLTQGGRSWQPLGEGKNGHKNYRQAVFDKIKHFCLLKVFQKVQKSRQILAIFFR